MNKQTNKQVRRWMILSVTFILVVTSCKKEDDGMQPDPPPVASDTIRNTQTVSLIITDTLVLIDTDGKDAGALAIEMMETAETIVKANIDTSNLYGRPIAIAIENESLQLGDNEVEIAVSVPALIVDDTVIYRALDTMLDMNISFVEIKTPDASSTIIFDRREMRGIWLTTVFGLDWPKSTNAAAQKDDLIYLLDQCVDMGLNTVVFQVRPMADALYRSQTEVWASVLTGTQGSDPGYDPLQFAIDECEKRGLELHAWMNPYRLMSKKSTNEVAWSIDDHLDLLATGHPIKSHPDWVVPPNSYKYLQLNPGIPAVNDYLVGVIKEIIDNYDVDAIHFDDYFYQGNAKVPGNFDDQAQYDAYTSNGGTMSLDDWRFNNINEMVRKVDSLIKTDNPKVAFGISPAGRIGNTKALYADPLQWIDAQTIDYLAPQVYWSHDHRVYDARFDVASNYWADKATDATKMVIGMATYDAAGISLSEMEKQMDFVRNHDDLSGTIQFRMRDRSLQSSRKALTSEKNTYKALVPVMGELTLPVPGKPSPTVSGTTIGWGTDGAAEKYAVYELVQVLEEDNTFEAKIVEVTKETSFDGEAGKHYIVSAVNDDNAESPRSEIVSINN